MTPADLDLAEIGEVLRQARRCTGLSQEGLAALVDGADQRTISLVERGLSPNVSAVRLHRIAQVLGYAVTITPVFGERARLEAVS